MPHFTNALPTGHQGENREQRIRELLVVAPELTVIGLPEGNWIRVTDGHATLGGPGDAVCCSKQGRSDNPACGPPLLSLGG
ncbi:Type 1 glutamine amidotransferase-like domain-containing protein [Klebsiella pneumoniae]|nr:Type 1 glutamine amidotransferase-like domain-containing protein [Klebsiella pneumoniae]